MGDYGFVSEMGKARENVCVCVWDRERESKLERVREIEKDREREKEREGDRELE